MSNFHQIIAPQHSRGIPLHSSTLQGLVLDLTVTIAQLWAGEEQPLWDPVLTALGWFLGMWQNKR